jgi:hypothetical protein
VVAVVEAAAAEEDVNYILLNKKAIRKTFPDSLEKYPGYYSYSRGILETLMSLTATYLPFLFSNTLI